MKENKLELIQKMEERIIALELMLNSIKSAIRDIKEIIADE